MCCVLASYMGVGYTPKSFSVPLITTLAKKCRPNFSDNYFLPHRPMKSDKTNFLCDMFVHFFISFVVMTRGLDDDIRVGTRGMPRYSQFHPSRSSPAPPMSSSVPLPAILSWNPSPLSSHPSPPLTSARPVGLPGRPDVRARYRWDDLRRGRQAGWPVKMSV